jgi:hypothetical protein
VPNNIDAPERPSANMKGVPSPLNDEGAAAVDCSAGADLLAEAPPVREEVAVGPVDSGVSP